MSLQIDPQYHRAIYVKKTIDLLRSNHNELLANALQKLFDVRTYTQPKDFPLLSDLVSVECMVSTRRLHIKRYVMVEREWNAVRDRLKYGAELYLGELDGKHSSVTASLTDIIHTRDIDEIASYIHKDPTCLCKRDDFSYYNMDYDPLIVVEMGQKPIRWLMLSDEIFDLKKRMGGTVEVEDLVFIRDSLETENALKSGALIYTCMDLFPQDVFCVPSPKT